jgi:hypothetical protein
LITLGDTVGRTLLDEGSARRRSLYMTTHNTHKRETSLFPAGIEPAVPASERSQTHALDRAATEIGFLRSCSDFEMKIRPRHTGYISSLCAPRWPQYFTHKCKVEVHPRTGYGVPEGEKRYSFTLSFTSAVEEGKRSTPRLVRFTPVKVTCNPSYRRLGGPQGLSGQVRKISPHRVTMPGQSGQ